MNPIELAKETYEKRKGVKINKVEPVYCKSTGQNSKHRFLLDGQRAELIKWKDNDYDFLKVG